VHQIPILAGAPALDPLALLAYLALFGATAFLANRRPVYAAAALIATTPFALYRDLFEVTLTLNKVALVAALCGLGWRAAGKRLDVSGARAVLPIAIALVALVVLTGITIAQAAHPDAVVRETFKAAQYAGLALVAFLAWRNDPDERPIRYALAATTAVVAVVALAQEYSGAPSVLRAGNDLVPRIAGALEGPNQLAGFLGLALPLAFAFTLSRTVLPGEAPAIALGLVALIFTLSRGGTAAALAGIVLAVAGSPLGNFRRLIPIAFLTGFLAFDLLAATGVARGHAWSALFSHMLSASESAQPGGVGRRSELWQAALVLWNEHPWLGIGAGNYEYAVGSLVPGVRTHANNAYLQALAEGGIPLAAATAAALLAPLVLFARDARKSSLILGALASCTAFALHQGVDDLLFFPKVGGLFFIIVGLAAGEIARLRATARPAGSEHPGEESVATGPMMGMIRLAITRCRPSTESGLGHARSRERPQMIRRAGVIAAILVTGLAFEAAAQTAPAPAPEPAPPAASSGPAASAAPSPAASTAPGSLPVPAQTPLGGASPAPSGTPPASPTPSPYHYVVVPTQRTNPPFGGPLIVEVALNERTLEVPGPVLVRITTSANVGAVTARVFGRQMGIPQIAPGLFGGADQMPSLPTFLLGRSYDVEFIASTPDGRSTSVTLPVGLR
jgi:O-antigen ligase